MSTEALLNKSLGASEVYPEPPPQSAFEVLLANRPSILRKSLPSAQLLEFFEKFEDGKDDWTGRIKYKIKTSQQVDWLL